MQPIPSCQQPTGVATRADVGDILSQSVQTTADNRNSTKKESDLLYAISPEGQAHRESALSGKKVVIVSCGSDTTKNAIYTRTASLGIKIFLVDSPDSSYAAKLKGIIPTMEHIHVDLSMRSTILTDCVKAIDAHLSDGSPDAVLTFWDDAVGLTARIAEHYNVVSNSVESIDISHDKFLSRRRLEESGVPVPKYECVHNLQEMELASQRMSFPAILKPCQGAASIGVSMVKNADDAVKAYSRTVAVMQKVMKDGDLMGLVFDDTDNTRTFVLEEFIDGEEVDVDMCLFNGDVVYSNINGDWPDEDERFIELGISFPAACNEGRRGEEFREAALACCRAIGVLNGVVHVEMKYSSRYGPTLVELNPRMGGGPLYQFHKYAYDVDLVTEHLLVMCGLPSAPPAIHTHKAVCTCFFVYAQKDGICGEDMNYSKLAEDLRRRPHMISVKYTAKKGDRVTSWHNRNGFPTCLGRLDIAVDRNEMEYDEVIEYCKTLREVALQIPYEDEE